MGWTRSKKDLIGRTARVDHFAGATVPYPGTVSNDAILYTYDLQKSTVQDGVVRVRLGSDGSD